MLDQSKVPQKSLGDSFEEFLNVFVSRLLLAEHFKRALAERTEDACSLFLDVKVSDSFFSLPSSALPDFLSARDDMGAHYAGQVFSRFARPYAQAGRPEIFLHTLRETILTTDTCSQLKTSAQLMDVYAQLMPIMFHPITLEQQPRVTNAYLHGAEKLVDRLSPEGRWAFKAAMCRGIQACLADGVGAAVPVETRRDLADMFGFIEDATADAPRVQF